MEGHWVVMTESEYIILKNHQVIETCYKLFTDILSGYDCGIDEVECKKITNLLYRAYLKIQPLTKIEPE